MFSVIIDSAIVVSAGSNITTTKGIDRSSSAFTSAYGTGAKSFALSDTITGITIDSVTGIVTVANTVDSGTYYETVTSIDIVGAIGQKAMTILVNIPVAIAGGSNVTTTFGRADTSTAFTASGGTAPLRFTISPTVAGITIDSITGIVYVANTTVAGTYNETVTVTDTVTAFATKTLIVKVNPGIVVSMAGAGNYGSTGGVTPIVEYNPTTITSAGFTDAMGNSNATFTGTPTVSSGVATFAGNSYAYTQTNLASKFNSNTYPANYTVFMRVKPTGDGVILNEYGTTTPNSGWADSQIEMVGGVMKFRTWNLGTVSSSALTLNTWYNVAITYDQVAQLFSAYINGVLVGTATGSRSTPMASGFGLYYGIGTTDPANLGSGAYGNFSMSQFDVYNQTLSAAQIANLSGSGGNAITTTITIPQTSNQAVGTGGTDSLTLSMSPTNIQGISFDSSTGRITADSSTAAGTYVETITATDRLGVTGSSAYTILVNPAIAFTTGNNIITTKGIARSSDTFTATLGTGTKNYSLSETITGISIGYRNCACSKQRRFGNVL